VTALSPAIIRDNPWWGEAAAIDRDPDLLRLAAAPVRVEVNIPFRLDVDAVYTLRGPRQVGKSTLLKRVVATLLRDRRVAPRAVLYMDVEGAGVGTVMRLRNVLTGYLAWVRTTHPTDRVYLFLDEVTGVRNWGSVIRALFREGALTNVTVLATGSHALDIAQGGESAPGRRGERDITHPDWILMPFAFRDYLRAHAPALVDRLPALDTTQPRHAYAAAQEITLHQDAVLAFFERYLLTGGYPHATAAEQLGGRIDAGVYQLYRAAITGQMKRAGYREGPFREIVTWAAAAHLGREFSWNAVAADTDVGTKDTARRYVEDAEKLFLWHVLQRARSATTPAPALRSPKKLYPVDPFSWHVLASWAAGDADPWAASVTRLADPAIRGELVESVAADHFIRGYAPFAFYHRAPQGQEEIDLVLHRESAQSRIEIKYRQRVTKVHANHLAKYGGGLLVTVDALEYDGDTNVAQIPLYALLAGYAEPITLYPAPT
jgi:predicted AAA+ superfamily ATPase